MSFTWTKIFFATVLIALTSCIGEKNPVMLEVGDQVPEFSVETSTDEVVSNRSLLGAVSCILFFHTSCPDCQKTLPEMQRIYEEFSGRGVKFILISREQTREEIEPYWTDRGYTMPYSPQRTREIYEKFAQSRIPRVYISDKNGIIKAIFTDNPTPVYSDLKSAIESL